MREPTDRGRICLASNATVAVIGGGPAGSFFALHLLRLAALERRNLRVVIFERRLAGFSTSVSLEESWRGCNFCAGGFSPRLNEALREMRLELPPQLIQSRIECLTIQGFWKNIELQVPAGRELLSVYRGSRPAKRPEPQKNFDSFLLNQARKAGAIIVEGTVRDVRRGEQGKPVLTYQAGGTEHQMEPDFAVFATGVNGGCGMPVGPGPILESLKRLLPGYTPPRLRQTLIFELQANPEVPSTLARTVHFVEYGSRQLRLEMCSLVPKKGFITVVLIGPSVDTAHTSAENREIIRQFLELPHIRKLLAAPGLQLSPACLCNPNMVVGSAKRPFADRVAAVGDLVTSRLNKDGIFSSHQMAQALAQTVLKIGIDSASLQAGYAPLLRRFRRDNRFAALVFLLHRFFFSSSILSRVLYQAVITERKTTPRSRRNLEKLLWRIASGDDSYERIFRFMMQPASLWAILMGALITLRNYVTELGFGLRWEGFGRFTTGVALERLEAKRRQFARLLTDSGMTLAWPMEFERMYTIKISAPPDRILEQIGSFGEADRGYFRPRWVTIRRIAGVPGQPGCVIEYQVVSSRWCFRLRLESCSRGHFALYRVLDGFARNGVLLFEIEELDKTVCALSIYVTFNFARGKSIWTRPLWALFRGLFPAYMHDVLWNHSLCQFKDLVEKAAG